MSIRTTGTARYQVVATPHESASDEARAIIDRTRLFGGAATPYQAARTWSVTVSTLARAGILRRVWLVSGELALGYERDGGFGAGATYRHIGGVAPGAIGTIADELREDEARARARGEIGGGVSGRHVADWAIGDGVIDLILLGAIEELVAECESYTLTITAARAAA